MIEMPHLPYDEVAGETVAAGYLNLYICNGAVIVPVTGADRPTRRRWRSSAAPSPTARSCRCRERCSPTAAAGRTASPSRSRSREVPERITQLLTRLSPPPRIAGPDGPARGRRCGSGSCRSAGTPTPTSTRRRSPTGIRAGRRRGRADRLPAGADVVAVLRDHARRPRRPRARRPRPLEDGPDRSRSPVGSPARPGPTCTRRCSSAPTRPDGLGYNTAIVVAPDGRLVSRARASSTSRSPPATTRTSTSGPGPPTSDPFPLTVAAAHR